MSTWIFIVLAGALIVVGIQLRSLKRRIRLLKESVEERSPLLLPPEGVIAGSAVFEELKDNTNELLRELVQRGAAEKNSVDQINATLGRIREAVFIVDSDSRLLMANEAFKGLLSIGSESVVGKRLETIIQSGDLFSYVRGIQSGDAADFFTLEVTLGTVMRWLEITGAVLQSGEEGKQMTLVVMHDISEQKRLERMRTEFVANLSHELRTPVTIIKGYADALIEDNEELDSGERHHFLTKIQNSVSRLNGMLEELLLLSRLETNPNALQMEMYSLTEVVREVTEDFRIRLEGDTQFVFDFAEGDDVLMFDPLRISQVLENLMENAVRHAKGITKIEVRTRIEEDGVTCAVIDDGAGIPERDLPHVFERFYRVDKGRSRDSGGTGLGLSIVKHIIQQHGGEATALSSPGGGTVIGFKLPFPRALAEKPRMSLIENKNPSLAEDPGENR